jgi:3-deoxy-D-manno-octulosonic acid kinase
MVEKIFLSSEERPFHGSLFSHFLTRSGRFITVLSGWGKILKNKKDWLSMHSTSPVPNGFSVIKVGRTELIIKDLYRDRLMGRKIHNPEALFRQHKDKARFMEGRGFLVSLPMDERGSERMVIRHYEHGGIFRALTTDLFLGGSRPFHELFITEMARKAGLPTMEVLVAVKRWVFRPFYKGDLVSKEIPNSTDLIQYVTRLRKAQGLKQLSKKRELIRQAGSLVRKMHEVGIYHSDLHLKNFIVQVKKETLGSLHVIDFDRATIIHPLKSDKWFGNLLRLDRSVEKWAAKGLWITRTDRLRFLKSYLGGEEKRKASVRKYLKGYPLRRMRYRLGWAIERLLYG